MASDNEHRTQHWVQLIAIANSFGARDAKIAGFEKEVEELKSAVHRSRSPRMRPGSRRSHSQSCWHVQLRQVPLLCQLTTHVTRGSSELIEARVQLKEKVLEERFLAKVRV